MPKSKPPRMPRIAVVFAILFMLASQGCAWFTPKNITAAEILARDLCIAAHFMLPEVKILEQCNLTLDVIDDVRKIVRSQKDTMNRAGVCKPGATFIPATRDELGTVSVSGMAPNVRGICYGWSCDQ